MQAPEGGGAAPGQYRRAHVEAVIQVEKVEQAQEGAGPRQCRRAEVDAAIQVEMSRAGTRGWQARHKSRRLYK